jgi:prevent-host-death family protein
MDLNEIKKIIEEDGGKIIIVENGEPVMVVTSYAEYKKGRSKPEPKAKEKSLKPLPPELSAEELKIEDLPF